MQPLSILCRSFQDVDKYTMGFPRGNSQGQTNVFRAARQCLPGPVSVVEPFLCDKYFFACGAVWCFENYFASCMMSLMWVLCTQKIRPIFFLGLRSLEQSDLTRKCLKGPNIGPSMMMYLDYILPF